MRALEIPWPVKELARRYQGAPRPYCMSLDKGKPRHEFPTQIWSNGPTEGFVHKLKLLKRQGYGRAGFDLLRQRMLCAA